MFRIGSDKKANMLFFFCVLAYYSSYIMRYNYSAALSEIITAEGIPKSSAGLVSTALFFAYGLGQIASGILGDRMKPYKLIFGGLTVAALINAFMPLAGSVGAMTALWAVNGFSHSMLWPPLVRMMSENFDEPSYNKAIVNISLACAAGTISVYLLAPLCIWLSGWKLLFFVSGGFGLLVAVGWILYVPGHQLQKTQEGTNSESCAGKVQRKTTDIGVWHLFAIAGVFPVLAAVFAQGCIRDGVTTWVPKMLAEVFSMENTDSILITVLLPILTVIALKITAAVNNKFFRNEIDCAFALFFVSFAACTALIFAGNISAALTLALAGIAVSSIHGVNLMLICGLPSHFGKYGKISTVSGIVNTFTYIGSAASIYGFALIQENFGWNVLIITWVGLDLLGLFALSLAKKKWRKFIGE